MKPLPIQSITVAPLLALCCLLVAPDPVSAQLDARMRSSFYYTTPASVLRGQLALQRGGDLEKGSYEPGLYDPPTRRAIRAFQQHHNLRKSGRFDRDTYAVLRLDKRPDQDEDGIPDPDDRCPKTKKGARVGLDGCPLSGEGTSSPDAGSGTTQD